MILSSDKTNDFVALVSSISENDPFVCRIVSLYMSYGPSLPFVDYWVVIDDKSRKCTGAIARSGTDFILSLTDEADLEEISSFMRVAGAFTVICSAKYELDLYGYRTAEGPILSRNTRSNNDTSMDIVIPQIKDAYSLIVASSDENFTPPPFDDFYVDVNHKLRHETMRLFGVCEEDTLSAVAMTVAESYNGAVIGAVACLPEMRNKGFGSYIVDYLTDILVSEGKCVYVHRAENANKSFYENLGFNQIDVWREYHFEG